MRGQLTARRDSTLSNYLEAIRDGDFSTRRGLAFLLVLVGALVVAGAKGLGVPWQWSTPALGFALLVATGGWLWWRWWVRRIPRFREDQIGILIAFNWSGPTKDRKWVEDVLDALQEEIKARASGSRSNGQTSATFVVRTLHRSVALPEDRVAHEVVLKSGAAFMSWATVTAGRRGLQANVIKTIVRHRTLDPRRQAMFSAALHEVWDGARQLKVDVENDVEDIGEAARQLTLVATYQMGLAATASGAIDLAEPLLRQVASTDGGPRRYVRRARTELSAIAVAPWLGEAFPMPGVGEPKLSQAIAAADDATAWDSANPYAAGLKACALFLQRRKAEAHRANERLKSIAPDWYALNSAVFALDRDQYDAALVYYKRAARRLRNNFDPHRSAMRWLEAAVTELGPAYSFGLAYMLDRFQ